MIKRTVLISTLFLSAFLLFLVQPMAAKVLLPRFGGTSAVWAACLLFFQFFLLVGYVYADRLGHWFDTQQKGWLHIAVLLLSLVLLPVALDGYGKAGWTADPALQVLLMLTLSIGLPYLLLASTGPLLQSFFAEAHLGVNVYRLYAISNIASLLALVSYPFTVERWLPVQRQLQIWSCAYGVFAILSVATVWLYATQSSRWSPASSSSEQGAKHDLPKTSDYWVWIGFAALGTALLVAVTLNITLNIASIPLFWILPLAVYLFSFVVTFDSDRWYSHRLVMVPMVFFPALILLTQRATTSEISLPVSVTINTVGLFVCCWFLHGELSIRKPASRYLTRFYMAVSLGGALGGLFGSLIAPVTMTGFHELEVLTLTVAATAFWVLRKHLGKRLDAYLISTALLLSVVLCAALGVAKWGRNDASTRASMRNFYGVLSVIDAQESNGRLTRRLFNGAIEHGSQVLEPVTDAQSPGDYYGSTSGIGMAIESLPSSPRRVGVIGLGAGVLAAYGRGGDHFTFYEINPQSIQVAQTLFSYLEKTKSKVDVVEGDARLVLTQGKANPDQAKLQLLAVDAFSGDAIPMHLLTLEAFQVYRSQLVENGILAVHISNKYLNLRPVLLGAANALGWEGFHVHSPGDGDRQRGSDWVIMVKDPAPYRNSPWMSNGHRLSAGRLPHGPIVWTDGNNNLLDALAGQ
ncbi:fused MFS/spermidine synthase [Hydrogenophaga sp. PAMC20947]|uniref:fused MFS/spermidine synthase n=1 Tax=Hydrogenophaga sp. PAMC20947 TaxID=2565558 RepID=UPI00109E272C|nr:fused MFS/spermidine synthase [Hydrogenophaga sp. PAMC20947]QCB47230.1 hypothetical protein E5678_15070 [Hydrogenophaga sp. PAMC20947]